MMEAIQTSVTSVNSYQSTWRYNPEGSHLQEILNIAKKSFGTPHDRMLTSGRPASQTKVECRQDWHAWDHNFLYDDEQ
jgi:hypothetical protein